MDILQAAADAKGATVDLIELLCSDAWESFERAIYECFDEAGAGQATLSWTFDYLSATHTRPSACTRPLPSRL